MHDGTSLIHPCFHDVSPASERRRCEQCHHRAANAVEVVGAVVPVAGRYRIWKHKQSVLEATVGNTLWWGCPSLLTWQRGVDPVHAALLIVADAHLFGEHEHRY